MPLLRTQRRARSSGRSVPVKDKLPIAIAPGATWLMPIDACCSTTSASAASRHLAAVPDSTSRSMKTSVGVRGTTRSYRRGVGLSGRCCLAGADTCERSAEENTLAVFEVGCKQPHPRKLTRHLIRRRGLRVVQASHFWREILCRTIRIIRRIPCVGRGCRCSKDCVARWFT